MYNDVRDLIGYRRLSEQPQNTEELLKRLVKEQKQCQDGCKEWYSLQEQINHIIAENFLLYVNRSR